jgi:hypothetical protein
VVARFSGRPSYAVKTAFGGLPELVLQVRPPSPQLRVFQIQFRDPLARSSSIVHEVWRADARNS